MRRISLALVLLCVATTLIEAGSPARAAGSRQPDRIVLVVMENKNYAEVVGNKHAPFVNDVIAPNSIGLTHMHETVLRPSLPNYVWMMAGKTCRAVDDDDWGRTCPSVFDQLLAARIPWHVYAEDYPGDTTRCSQSAYSDSSPYNHYARKHDPALLFDSTSSGGGCRFHVARFPKRDVVNATEHPKRNFQSVAFEPITVVIPNLCHDMHNSTTDCGKNGGGVAGGDRWLSKNWGDLIQAAGPHGVVILTWDEDGAGVGRIPTFIAGYGVVGKGTRDAATYSHSSTLRAIEDAFGLPCLATACTAAPLPLKVATSAEIVRAQIAIARGASRAPTATWPAPTVPGDLLIAVIAWGPRGSPEPPVGWTPIASSVAPGAAMYAIEGAPDRTGAEAFDLSQRRDWVLVLLEYSGLETASLDRVAADDSGATAVTTISSGVTAPTSEPSELALGALMDLSGESGSSFTNHFVPIATVTRGTVWLGVVEKVTAVRSAKATGATLANPARTRGAIATFVGADQPA